MGLLLSGVDLTVISYLRYNNTWGDWHGSGSDSRLGGLASFETVVIGANGVEKSGNRQVDGLVFKGIDGTNYGPYGGTSGTFWETDIPSGCSVQYISGQSGRFLDAISFHHNCLPNTDLTTTTTEGMNTDMHNS